MTSTQLGTSGNDTLLASGSGYTLMGLAGNDSIDGVTGKGNNVLDGGEGDDEIFAKENDTALGGSGNDYLHSDGQGNNILDGGDGNDTIFPDRNDKVFGGAGNDIIFSGLGGNTLTGGDGQDTFWLANAAYLQNPNIITDFNPAVDLLKVDVGGFKDINQLTFLAQGNDTLISANSNPLAILKNYNLSQFAITSASATEGNAISFTVTRTGDSQASQSVIVSTAINADDTASNNDLTTKTETLTFAVGETTKNFTVQTIQDNLFEANETFTVSLSNPDNGAIISSTNATAKGTINNDDAAPIFAITSASDTEGNAISFTVTRTGDSQASQSVTVSTAINADDTASNNDLTAKMETLTFAVGETTKNFTVQTTQDNLFEANETFTVSLSNPDNGAIISSTNATAKGTINNDDAAPIFAITSASATEGNAISFTVTRTGDSQASQSVIVSTAINADDTASNNDLTTKTETLTFAVGETTKNFTVQTIQDNLFEANETFTVSLSNPDNGAIISSTNATAKGTINNDDAAPIFAITSASDTEGNAISFTVTRTGDSQASQSVTVSTAINADDTASNNDLTAKMETLTFAVGETTKNFTVQTTQDNLFEANETFTVSLSNPDNGAIISSTNATAKGTINNDDAAPIFAITSASATEGNAISFTVTRTGDSQASQSVIVSTAINADDTASNNDLTTKTETLTFAVGETTKNFTVQTTQDNLFEANETFTVSLSNPDNGAIISSTNATAKGTINNDDAAPIFAITSASDTEGNAISFTVTRTGDSQASQSVTVSTAINADDTASNNDLTAKMETLTFATGETSKTFTVQTTQDNLFEANETFTVSLSNPDNGAIISSTNATAKGTINNDDAAPIFAITSASDTEGNAISFTVTRTGDSQASQSVIVSTAINADDTASNNDLTAKTETLTFATGETSKTFTVQTTQDNLFEANETFTVSLSNPDNGAIISSTNATAKGTINNDDAAPIFAITSASDTEGNAISFTVTRTGDSQASQSVTVSTAINADDTASNNDLTAKMETLTFAVGETTKNFTVQTTQDNLFEANETFTVSLSNPDNGAIISSTNATEKGTINNDDAAPIFAITSASDTEGNAISFTVTRTGDSQASQSVIVSTAINADDTASNNDLTAKTETLTFATGETSKTFTVQTTQDNLFEANETFTVSLSNPDNGAIISSTNATAKGTINNDDDAAAAPIFAITSASDTEGNAISFTVTRTGDSQASQSVIVSTAINADDTASNNDLTVKTETLTFAVGETTKNFTVQTTQDNLFEANETFTVSLSNPDNGAIISSTNATAKGTINNDDAAPIFAITSASDTEGNAISFTVTRTGDSQASQSVIVSTAINADDTASNNDLTAKTETLTFATGETSKTFTVQTTQDNLFEANETFTVSLSNPDNGAIISSTNATAKGTINNDDDAAAAAPIFAITSASDTEGNAISFTVTRTGDSQASQSVIVSTAINADDTASNNDLTTKTETLTFAVGETTKNFTVQTTQDNLFEANETFTVSLSNPDNGAIISSTNATAKGTINNDDAAPIFAITSASDTEGNAISFTVTRTGDSQASQSVIVSTAINADDTASNNDLSAKTETLTFALGETTKNFTVQTIQDSRVEKDETFTVNLSNPTNGAIISSTNNTTKGVIVNDDIPFVNSNNNYVFPIKGEGDKARLKVSLVERNSNSINELGVFNVDDAQGNINGIAPGAAGYNQAVLTRAKVIFSAISNLPNGVNIADFNRLLEFNSGDNLKFFFVKNETLDSLNAGKTPFSNLFIADASNQKITDLGDGGFRLDWEDGSGNATDFKDFVVKVQSTNDPLVLGTALQGGKQGEIIDLRNIKGQVKVDFSVHREAEFNNEVYFYKIDNADGQIGNLQATSANRTNYLQAALNNLLKDAQSGADIKFSTANQGVQTGTTTIAGGTILAPMIIINGTLSQLLDNNVNNDPQVYFPYLGINSDGVDHIRLLGNNTFGFEDLPNGGDFDYNDIVVKLNFTQIV